MNLNVILAIFRRNFVGYFSNPTGYVFICVFVLASSFAAFWPAEFFNANLANLDQLNRWLPFILIGFIPAITMGIWADERRQGTDELLLTIPATDLDVVLGKYLAVVAIYTVSLVFSLISNFAVLSTLGVPDFGLICGTYFGYWIVGLAMLAIGMVASFLVGNLTVAFILGVVLNAPLVFAAYADVMSSDSAVAGFIKRFSVTEQFRDFSRGVISISSLGYFFGIVALMLYLSMVLIGRRHWKGGIEGQGARVHYALRFVALAAAILGLNMVLARNDRLRIDVTSEHLSSLAPQTRKILSNLDTKYPITVDAYISPRVPESYTTTRLNLISALREFEAVSGDRIKVHIHNTEPLSEEAQRAETLYGIKAVPVMSSERGARKQEDLFMGVAFTSGLEKVVVPFFDRGLPVEYELIRSIATVASPKRKKLGVLTTDAKLYGGFDMQSMASTQDELIIDELKKQYDLVQVDPTNPITEKFDVLLAVQPSSLSPPQMENFVACVKSGQPTAIFEDPCPIFNAAVPGTAAPKQPAGGANPFMMRQPPGEKGDINRLWNLLGVDFAGTEVVWQDYNPYPKEPFSKEWVFIGRGSGAKEPFNDQARISSDLQQLLFPFPGSVRGQNASTLKFTPLVMTSEYSGEVPADQVFQRSIMGQGLNPKLSQFETETNEKYILAAKISGKLKTENVPMSDKEASPTEGDSPAPAAKESPAKPADDDKQGGETPAAPAAKAKAETDKTSESATKPRNPEPPAKPTADEINVVLVADIDCLYSAFFMVRARGQEDDAFINFDFDNVTFVLNTLDVLSGDDRFVEIRKRRFEHRPLGKLTEKTAEARNEADAKRVQFNEEFKAAKAEEQKKLDDEIKRLTQQKEGNENEVAMNVLMAQQAGQRRLETTVAQLEQKRDREIKQIERNLALQIRQVQDNYKMWAVLLPPIPPLLLGLYVFFHRRQKEREGVSKNRLR
jgi:ABC-2 type transport system permease protein